MCLNCVITKTWVNDINNRTIVKIIKTIVCSIPYCASDVPIMMGYKPITSEPRQVYCANRQRSRRS